MCPNLFFGCAAQCFLCLYQEGLSNKRMLSQTGVDRIAREVHRELVLLPLLQLFGQSPLSGFSVGTVRSFALRCNFFPMLTNLSGLQVILNAAARLSG